MRVPHFRSTVKSAVAILCAACFLNMSLGSVSRAIAADTWETWPKKTTEPGVEPKPETGANGAKAGEAAGKETAKKRSSRTIWWIAAGAAVVIGIGIAIAAGGGGGGDGGGGGSTNPGHH